MMTSCASRLRDDNCCGLVLSIVSQDFISYGRIVNAAGLMNNQGGCKLMSNWWRSSTMQGFGSMTRPTGTLWPGTAKCRTREPNWQWKNKQWVRAYDFNCYLSVAKIGEWQEHKCWDGLRSRSSRSLACEVNAKDEGGGIITAALDVVGIWCKKLIIILVLLLPIGNTELREC